MKSTAVGSPGFIEMSCPDEKCGPFALSTMTRTSSSCGRLRPAGVELVEQLLVLGVARLGAVQRDRRDLVLGLVENELHRCFSSLCRREKRLQVAAHDALPILGVEGRQLAQEVERVGEPFRVRVVRAEQHVLDADQLGQLVDAAPRRRARPRRGGGRSRSGAARTPSAADRTPARSARTGPHPAAAVLDARHADAGEAVEHAVADRAPPWCPRWRGRAARCRSSAACARSRAARPGRPPTSARSGRSPSPRRGSETKMPASCTRAQNGSNSGSPGERLPR